MQGRGNLQITKEAPTPTDRLQRCSALIESKTFKGKEKQWSYPLLPFHFYSLVLGLKLVENYFYKIRTLHFLMWCDYLQFDAMHSLWYWRIVFVFSPPNNSIIKSNFGQEDDEILFKITNYPANNYRSFIFLCKYKSNQSLRIGPK